MAQKSKFFRVAVSGTTIDGRTIDPTWLTQMAETYDPNTFTARGNLEHIRGATGEKPFTAQADVLALKAEPVELNVGGKVEKRVGLFAQIAPTDDLIALNARKQKLYTSIEVIPDFAGSKKAYLGGLAFTDSPASLGTERIEFSQRAKAYGNHLTDPIEIDLQVEEPPAATAAQVAAVGAFSAMESWFSGLTKPKVEPAPAPVVTPPAPAATDFAAFSAQMMTGMQALSTAITAAAAAQTAAVKTVADDLAAFKRQVETSPASNYTARPLSSGNDGTPPADEIW